MIIRAAAKINLGLDVTGRRDDGYHEVSMVMQSLRLHDTIVIETADDSGIRLSCNLPYIPVDAGNLAFKAAALLLEARGVTTGLSIRIDKRIPVAAGLAGGSADAAAVLYGVNRLLDLGFSPEELKIFGKSIGADVPFCLMRGTALAEGIGDRLTRLPPMPNCGILLAKPPFSVSTPKVYQAFDSEPPASHPDIRAIREALQRARLRDLCRSLGNVLEKVTGAWYPLIGELETAMKDTGAYNAVMSGSGPTVFGIYKDIAGAEQAAGTLRSRYGNVRFIVTAPYNRGGHKS